MIHILIITDDFDKWSDYIKKQVNIDKEIRRSTESSLINDLFYFSLRRNIRESERGPSWACVILDKEIDSEIERELLLPTIKQKLIRNTNLFNL